MSFTATSSSTAETSRAINWGRFAFVALGTVLAAIIANVLVYFIGSAFVIYDPQFIVLSNVSPAIIFTVVPAIVAVLLYAALLRFTRNPARIFTIIAIVVFIVTLIPDFTYIPAVPGATSAQTAILALMHVAAAVVIVGMLTTLTRQQLFSPLVP